MFYELGSEAYIMIPYEQRRKLDDKARKVRFIGYDENSKALRFIDENLKLYISREYRFLDKGTTEVEVNFFYPQEKRLIGHQEDGNKSISSNSEIQTEEFDADNSDSEISEEMFSAKGSNANNEGQNSNEDPSSDEEQQPLRRSTRENLGTLLKRFNDYNLYKANHESKTFEPRTFKQAVNSNNTQQWMEAMKEKLHSLRKPIHGN